MDAYLVSTLLVALAEMGDRTQLLAIMLAGRFRRPVPILLGILAATLANHLLAALAGFYLAGVLSAPWFRYAVSASFVAMALWALIPDKADDVDETGQAPARRLSDDRRSVLLSSKSATRPRSPRRRSPRASTTCSWSRLGPPPA